MARKSGRMSSITVNDTKIPAMKMPTNSTFNGGISEVREQLDKTWVMVIESWASRDLKYILRIWCEQDITITKID
jgi:hypothetical protein